MVCFFKRAFHAHKPFSLMVSLHLSSPPCREVVYALGDPHPSLHPRLLLHPSFLFPPITFSTPPSNIPSICTGRWLDGTSSLLATPPPWQTTNLHRGRGLPPRRVSPNSLAQGSSGEVTKERPPHKQQHCLQGFLQGATIEFKAKYEVQPYFITVTWFDPSLC